MREWSVIFNFIFSFSHVKGLDELGLLVLGQLALHDGEVDQVKQTVLLKWPGYFQAVTVYPTNSMNSLAFSLFIIILRVFRSIFLREKGGGGCPLVSSHFLSLSVGGTTYQSVNIIIIHFDLDLD